MQIVSNIALISINETVVVQLISFLIFLFIINRVMFRPLRGTVDERDAYMARMESEIEEAQQMYDRALANLKEQESAALNGAFTVSRNQEQDGNREAGKVFDSARGEIAALKEKAEVEISEQIQEARKTILVESEALAVAIMEKILDRRPAL